MEQENRKKLRRKSDRKLWAELQQLRNPPPEKTGDKETRSKRRRAIRKNCTVRIAVDKKEPIPAMAQVRWSKSIPEKRGFASGVKFKSLNKNDQKRLDTFLTQMDATVGL